eukprot:840687-Amphidinium_carterae.1
MSPIWRAVRIVQLFKEILPRVYKETGLEIEVNKSFPSDTFAIFLNEIYYAGVEVGSRAVLR